MELLEENSNYYISENNTYRQWLWKCTDKPQGFLQELIKNIDQVFDKGLNN